MLQKLSLGISLVSHLGCPVLGNALSVIKLAGFSSKGKACLVPLKTIQMRLLRQAKVGL